MAKDVWQKSAESVYYTSSKVYKYIQMGNTSEKRGKPSKLQIESGVRLVFGIWFLVNL